MAKLELIIRLSRTMLDELKSMAVFCHVVEQGSFRSAAKKLNLSPSVISHHVSSLEHKTGAALLYRSTRKLSLTVQGEALYESSRRMVRAAQEGLASLAFESEKPTGALTIAMAGVLVKSPLMSLLTQFSLKYDQVKLHLKLHDNILDLIEQGVDLTLRVGSQKDCGLKSRKVYQIERSLVAHPNWLKEHFIETLEDLHHIPWISPSMISSTRSFITPSGDVAHLNFTPKIQVDSVEAACQLAALGAGLTSPPKYLTQEYIQQGTLKEVLPEYTMQPLSVFALWQPNIQSSSLTYLFKDYLMEQSQHLLT